jgi:uncharacterized protein (TIGR03663 family)
MRNTLIFGVLIFTAAAAGLFLRLPLLHYRPLHTDEAVHAFKLGKLVEDNDYVYDKVEYHGPTLNYFTLIPAAIAGQKTFRDLDEFTIRIVPVFFGMVLVLLPLLMAGGIGRVSVFAAAMLTAVSPAMVYYSRYYIQEMLLVCFTFSVIACVFRYLQSRKVRWLLFAGISYGLMGATKETFVIACSCAFFAWVVLWYFSCEKGDRISNLKSSMAKAPIGAIAVFVVSAAVVWVVLFSSFFTNPKGIADSFLTYTTYLNRAHGEGTHHHAWYYYLQTLLFWKHGQGPVFTEALIAVLALIGGVFAFCKRNFAGENKPLVRFFALYTLSMVIAYSLIPYKTPWCLLGFLSGMIVLAGFACECLLGLVKGVQFKVAVCGVLLAGTLHLGVMAYLSGTKYAASPANPYVYGHTSMDIFEFSDRVIKTVNASDAGKDTVVQIVGDGGGCWPFPWYLRSLDKVGYWNGIDAKMAPAPLVIAVATSHDKKIDALDSQIIAHLDNSSPPGKRNLYLPLFKNYLQIRPHVEMRGFLTFELWEQTSAIIYGVSDEDTKLLKNANKR